MPERIQTRVLDSLRGLSDLAGLRRLFATLHYSVDDGRGACPLAGQRVAHLLAEAPSVVATHGDFQIVYCRLRSERLLRAHERSVVTALLPDCPHGLFVCSTHDGAEWDFVNVRHNGGAGERMLLRHIRVGPSARLELSAERIAMLDLGRIQRGRSRMPAPAVQALHDKAFDVEALREQFCKGCDAVHGAVQQDVMRQTNDAARAGEYALHFVIRAVRARFLPNEPCLGRDAEPSDRPLQGRYLGGEHKVVLSDAALGQVRSLLARNCFTVVEDTPTDQEVAVDPETVGRVCERLIAARQGGKARGDAGMFYTSRNEIDLMCRLALVDHLCNHLGHDNRNLLYRIVFAQEPEEKEAADQGAEQLWPEVDARLRCMTVLDPACGSGSFLVGMLQILDDLQERATRHGGQREPSRDRRERIVTQSLYGVDAMALACDTARWRLWLAIVADGRALPQDAVNVHCGDSLVDEASDVAFPQVMGGRDGGFDIVIGNPPYVRHENISAPGRQGESATPAARMRYKAALARTVYGAFPRFFGYEAARDTDPLAPHKAVKRRLDTKSDLYVYFYWLGLRSLNAEGTCCFLTSNSWLDVSYGKDIQEFLLKHCHVKMVLDNEASGSFASAEVNTVIALLSSADESSAWGLEHTARFATLRVPFAGAASQAIFEAIGSASNRQQTPEYRVRPVNQAALAREGSVRTAAGTGRYIGAKWGATYLRCPDICWVVRQKGEGKMALLSDLARVQRGVTTGANDFFCLDDARARQWSIEDAFLRPAIRSTSEIDRLVVRRTDARTLLFTCHLTEDELERQGCLGALSYIRWGAVQRTRGKGRQTRAGILLPQTTSLRANRPAWHCIRALEPGDFIVPRLIRERYFFAHNPDGVADTDMFFHGRVAHHAQALVALLNSSLTYLFLEVLGRHGIGGRFNLYGPELAQVLVVDPRELPSCQRSDIDRAFTNLAARSILKIADEISQPDRRALDDVVFAFLGLTKGERDGVYESLAKCVSARLAKEASG